MTNKKASEDFKNIHIDIKDVYRAILEIVNNGIWVYGQTGPRLRTKGLLAVTTEVDNDKKISSNLYLISDRNKARRRIMKVVYKNKRMSISTYSTNKTKYITSIKPSVFVDQADVLDLRVLTTTGAMNDFIEKNKKQEHLVMFIWFKDGDISVSHESY